MVLKSILAVSLGAALGALAYYTVTRGKPLVEGPLEETVALPDQEAAR